MTSYRDVLAKRERRRADGSPVWPLRDADLPSRMAAAAGQGERARG